MLLSKQLKKDAAFEFKTFEYIFVRMSYVLLLDIFISKKH